MQHPLSTKGRRTRRSLVLSEMVCIPRPLDERAEIKKTGVEASMITLSNTPVNNLKLFADEVLDSADRYSVYGKHYLAPLF